MPLPSRPGAHHVIKLCSAIGLFSTLDGFDWDDGNCRTCEQHGVALAEVEAVLHGAPAIWPDLEHSQKDTRALAIGRGQDGNCVFAAFTIWEREGGRFLRPISAR